MIGHERMWKLASAGIGMLGGLLARKLMRAGYRAVRKDAAAPSPFDPTERPVLVARRPAVGGGGRHRPRHRQGAERPPRRDGLGGRHRHPPPGSWRNQRTPEFGGMAGVVRAYNDPKVEMTLGRVSHERGLVAVGSSSRPWVSG